MNQFITMFTEYWLYLGIPVAFLVMMAWVFRPAAKKRYQADGNIPFEGGENEIRTGENSDQLRNDNR